MADTYESIFNSIESSRAEDLPTDDLELSQLAAQLESWYLESESRDGEWLARAQDYYDLYRGTSWDPKTRQELEDAGRPALELNIVRPMINLVTGMQLTNLTGLEAVAFDPSDDPVAEAITKHIQYQEARSRYDVIQAHCFRDGLVTGRAYREGYFDWSENPYGELKYRYVPPGHVKFDTYSRSPDLSDARYIFRAKWVDPDTFKSLFPNAVAHINKDLFQRWGEEFLVGNKVSGSFSSRVGISNPSAMWKSRKAVTKGMQDRVLFVDAYWKQRANRWFALASSKIAWKDFSTKEDARAFADAQGGDWLVVERPSQIIRHAILGPGCFLSKPKESPFGNRAWPVFPFFPDFLQGQTDGIVDDVKDFQKLLNKLVSQVLHMVNQTANRPIILESGSVQDPQAVQQQMNTASGLIVHNPGSRPPKWGDPPVPDPALFQVWERMDSLKQAITGLTPAILGVAMGSREPAAGTAIRRQQASNVLIFGVFAWLQSELMRGTWSIDSAQRLLTLPHIIRIAGEEEGQMDTIGMNQVQEENGALKIINDLSVGTYDIKLNQIPTTAMLRERQVDRLIELSQAGAPIPPEAILELMPGLPSKIKAQIQASVQQARVVAQSAPGSQVKV